MLYLSGPLYFGGVADITPYIRSKLNTGDGFVGCLGVRHFDRVSEWVSNLSFFELIQR